MKATQNLEEGSNKIVIKMTENFGFRSWDKASGSELGVQKGCVPSPVQASATAQSSRDSCFLILSQEISSAFSAQLPKAEEEKGDNVTSLLCQLNSHGLVPRSKIT